MTNIKITVTIVAICSRNLRLNCTSARIHARQPPDFVNVIASIKWPIEEFHLADASEMIDDVAI